MEAVAVERAFPRVAVAAAVKQVDAEAARDKFPHFLRKTLWKFVALSATLLHFLQKRHFCRFLFYQLHMAISPLVLPVLLLPME